MCDAALQHAVIFKSMQAHDVHLEDMLHRHAPSWRCSAHAVQLYSCPTAVLQCLTAVLQRHGVMVPSSRCLLNVILIVISVELWIPACI
jgi:hypothetical protein